MAEQTSRQAARLASNAAGGKMRGNDSGSVRVSVITGPDTVVWAQNDTCGNRDRIPKGSRLLKAVVSTEAMGAGVTMDVGVRAWTSDGTGAAIDADGIVAALDVSSAVNASYLTGAMVKSGTETGILTADAEPYFTLAGANPTDDKDVRVDVYWIGP